MLSHFYQQLHEDYTPVFPLLKVILRFFAPQGQHVAPMKVKFDVEESTAKLIILTNFWHINAQQEYPLGNF